MGSTVYHDPQPPWPLGEGYVWLPDGETVVGALTPALAMALKDWQMAHDFWAHDDVEVDRAVTTYDSNADWGDADSPSSTVMFAADRAQVQRLRAAADAARLRFYRHLNED
jgi:hypothetical protein